MMTTMTTDLSDDVGLVDLSAEAPAVQAFLLLQAAEVDVPAGKQTPVGQILHHLQPVPATLAANLGAAAVLTHHRNDSICPDCAQVEVWYQAVVLRCRPHKHDVETVETSGNEDHVEEEESAPEVRTCLAQEGRVLVVVSHGSPEGFPRGS